MGSFWSRPEVVLGSFWGCPEIVLESSWGRPGVILESFSSRSGGVLERFESVLVRPGSVLDHFWVKQKSDARAIFFWALLGVFWGRSGRVLGLFWGCSGFEALV